MQSVDKVVDELVGEVERLSAMKQFIFHRHADLVLKDNRSVEEDAKLEVLKECLAIYENTRRG